MASLTWSLLAGAVLTVLAGILSRTDSSSRSEFSHQR
jgi:hypothetical protein